MERWASGPPGPDGKPMMNGDASLAPQEETPLHTCLFHLIDDPQQEKMWLLKIQRSLNNCWDDGMATVLQSVVMVPKQLTFDPALRCCNGQAMISNR